MAQKLLHRVKVFTFGNSTAWQSLGTGVVSTDYIEVTGGEVLTITVRSEVDNAIIVQSKVLPERLYTLQEGLMIMWTENSSCELALSFQEKKVCDDIWKKIHKAQSLGTEDAETSDRFDAWIPDLPPCELGELENIMKIVVFTTVPGQQRELAVNIESEGYIPKLLDLFHICEDLNNKEGLHHLYHIFKAFFLFNNASLLQVMFQDDTTMMDVIGSLENSPNKAEPTRHREYLSTVSSFKQVIPFTNEEILSKIHETYKIQYIQEVILPTPSLFEENMMSALNSIVLFNKYEIVVMIRDDHAFLQQLFSGLCSESTEDSKYQQLVSLLREVCVFSLALKKDEQTEFFKEMNKHGFLVSIEGMLVYEDISVVSVAVDILNLTVEFNSRILMDHIVETKDSPNEDGQLMNIIISLLVDGECTDVQLVTLIKSLVNPDSVILESSTTEAVVQAADNTPFLKYFYKNCIPRLLAPLMAQTSDNCVSKDTSQMAILLSHILEVLSLCVCVHKHHIRNYVIDKNILSRVLVLLASSHGHLVLASLRLCRRIVELKDDIFNNHIVYMNLFKPILNALMVNGRNNLVNSAILGLFEYIKVENIQSLVKYTVERFMASLEELNYTKTFQQLKEKHKQNKLKDDKKNVSGSVVVETRYNKRDPRQMEEEEEAWFDDEEEEFVPRTTTLQALAEATNTTNSDTPSSANFMSISFPQFSSSATVPVTHRISYNNNSYFDPISTALTMHSTSTYSPRPATVMSRTSHLTDTQEKTPPIPTMSSALQSLVDYDEDSDEEMSNLDESSESSESSSNSDNTRDSEASPSSLKRQKLT